MENYVISCCSTADLSKEHFDAIDVKYICFHFELDGKQYEDNLGVSIPFDEFYSRMANGADTKTSQVNAEEFEEYFRSFLEQGLDILHVSLSSGISGVINSANIAKETLQEEFPDRKIYVVDSLAASSGYGLLMDKLSELRAQGKTIDEVRFIKGGRVTKTAGFIGSVLNICPLLNVDYEGKLIPRYKIRTKKKVIQAIVDRMEECAEDGLDYSGKCYISQSACYDDARAVADLIEAKFPKLNGKVEINHIGTTIGSHTGPGTVALFFWGKKRVD